MQINNSLSEKNVLKILRLIWQRNGISRVEIASLLGLDKSTVTKIASSLKNTGIIYEVAQGTSGPQGGRRPVFLEISDDFACIGGIEINPEFISCCLISVKGLVVYKENQKLNPEEYSKLGFEGVFEKTLNILNENAKKLNLKLLGYGLGIPGLVNSKEKSIYYSIPLMISTDYDFDITARKYTNLPVMIENDARCCCYGEMVAAETHHADNMLYLLTEYRVLKPLENSGKNLSIGIGLVLNGEVVKGPEGFSGEFRSILWQKGNLGQFLSKDDNLDLDKFSDSEIEEIFCELAKHVAFLVHILNLQNVCMGGGIDKKYEAVLERLIKQRIELQWPYTFEKKIQVYKSSFDSFAVAYGAASMLLEQLFSEQSISSEDKNLSILSYLKI